MVYQPINVRQPLPEDLVGDPVGVSGVGTGFEGTFTARVRDGNGTELGSTTIHAGGTGIWGNFQVTVPLGVAPAAPRGAVEVFELSAKDGSEINTVAVPIVFGTALVNPFHGFAQHTVAAGETLAAIAQQWYGNSASWPSIFEANRDQITDPNLIQPGQVLRVPQ